MCFLSGKRSPGSLPCEFSRLNHVEPIESDVALPNAHTMCSACQVSPDVVLFSAGISATEAAGSQFCFSVGYNDI